ncbi:MAG: outer membrane protein assembly factor BamB [Proteobacteria bacterium]|nr:outer membrane protein assembly factor BamB [Pseudomonadota bacterium]
MRKLTLLVSASVMLLAGCSTLSSLNPFASKTPSSNAPVPLTEFNQTMAVRTAWSLSVGSAGAYTFSPVIVSGDVFAAAADGSITRVDVATGRTIWRISADSTLTAGVGSDGNTVAVAGAKGAILAFDGNGKQRWKAQASSEILSSPVVAQGMVIVRSADNKTTAYDAETGTRRWVTQHTAPALILRGAPGILVAGPSAFVAMPGGKLASLALGNGGIRWEATVGAPRGTTELERIADTAGMPILLGNEICAVAYHGRISCFDAGSGATRWAKAFSSDVGLGADERFIYGADENGAVAAFARDSGASVWRNTQLKNRRLSAPLAVGRAVAVGDYQGYIHFLSSEDGALLARVATDGSPVVGTPLLAGSLAIFQTKSGTLVALATN